jgi:hypothetical protein
MWNDYGSNFKYSFSVSMGQRRGFLMTPAQKDKYLQKKYGITLAKYNEMLEEQAGVCAICGWKPTEGKRALAVDHDHGWKKVKHASYTVNGIWIVCTVKSDYTVYKYITTKGRTKSEALTKFKKILLTASVRGLLCWNCNRGLQIFKDSTWSLHTASNYIRNHRDTPKTQGVV